MHAVCEARSSASNSLSPRSEVVGCGAWSAAVSSCDIWQREFKARTPRKLSQHTSCTLFRCMRSISPLNQRHVVRRQFTSRRSLAGPRHSKPSLYTWWSTSRMHTCARRNPRGFMRALSAGMHVSLMNRRVLTLTAAFHDTDVDILDRESPTRPTRLRLCEDPGEDFGVVKCGLYGASCVYLSSSESPCCRTRLQ